MTKKWLSMLAPLLFLTISLAPSMNAQATWNSMEEFRSEYMRLLDTLSQRVPSSDESTWAVDTRQKISDIRQQLNDLSYPALDKMSRLTDRRAFTKMVDGLTAGDSSTMNSRLAPKTSLRSGLRPLAVINPPDFSGAVAGTTCSTSPTSAGVIDGEKIGLYVDRGLSLLAETACEAAPDVLGEGTNTIPCGIAGITKAVEVVLDSLIDHQEFCNGLLEVATAEATLADVTDIHADVDALDTHLTNVNTQITGEFAALDTHLSNVDTHLTNVDNHVTAEFVALDAHMVTLVAQLSTQIAQGTALLNADLRQVMKLELTPNGLKQIVPAILTCTGTNCPNVLALCPAAGCSWNNVGPLP
jgi:hypothetical protein